MRIKRDFVLFYLREKQERAGGYNLYSEQNPRVGHFTYVFKQLIQYIIAARCL